LHVHSTIDAAGLAKLARKAKRAAVFQEEVGEFITVEKAVVALRADCRDRVGGAGPPPSIARRQDGAVLGGRDALERANHFVGTEHDREAARFLWRGDQIIERPRLLEGDFIEEAQGTDGDAERTGGQFPFAGQVT
jgi:hypothetical protein